jgi:hypothetical protein
MAQKPQKLKKIKFFYQKILKKIYEFKKDRLGISPVFRR